MGEQESIGRLDDSAGSGIVYGGTGAGTGAIACSRSKRIAGRMGECSEQEHGQDILCEHVDERVNIYPAHKSVDFIAILDFSSWAETDTLHATAASNGSRGHVDAGKAHTGQV